MVETFPVIISFFPACSAKHTVDTQMNVDWQINGSDGNEEPRGFTSGRILSCLYA